MVEYATRNHTVDPLQDASRDSRDEDHTSNIMSLESRARHGMPEEEHSDLWHYPADKAHQGEIVPHRPWQRIIFVGTLAAIIVIALAGTVFTFWSQL